MSANTQKLRKLIHRRVRVYFRRESQIHDVTQDALLELLSKLEAGETLALDLETCANTAARNAVRREYTRLRHYMVEYESQIHGLIETNQVERLDALEDLRRINALFGEEQEEHQLALTSTLAGSDHKELAAELGVSPGAARMTLSRARANLHSRLSTQQKISQLIQLAKNAGLIQDPSEDPI